MRTSCWLLVRNIRKYQLGFLWHPNSMAPEQSMCLKTPASAKEGEPSRSPHKEESPRRPGRKGTRQACPAATQEPRHCSYHDYLVATCLSTRCRGANLISPSTTGGSGFRQASQGNGSPGSNPEDSPLDRGNRS
jgi:hypothetical protein